MCSCLMYPSRDIELNSDDHSLDLILALGPSQGATRWAGTPTRETRAIQNSRQLDWTGCATNDYRPQPSALA